ncbi:DNA translocase FtsK 4TM domain-containing protein [Blattabacterium cuenoti]|uniref:DNA translocase FtsK 4TM domain-containing protein n=1 Tax=Blattabacterium cuenoti TaxID=1653831 RepID=UPI001EEC6C1D|nr:DNA translocase FtsK 4TM domain-containing protein [Blattabacterium cuenoti]
MENTILGFFLLGISIFFIISFFSFFFHWKNDQSQLEIILDKETTVENLLGKTGAIISHCMIYCGIGISAIFIPIFLFISGLKFIVYKKLIINNIYKYMIYDFMFFSIWIPITFYLFITNKEGGLYSGIFGFEIGNLFISLFGRIGTYIIIFTSIISYIIILFQRKKKKIIYNSVIQLYPIFEYLKKKTSKEESKKIKILNNEYPFYSKKQINISNDTNIIIENNKKKINQILGYYKIKIIDIKATIGPSITLYEVSPHIGVRISKIKNLEKEIALNLSATSIRIIAPIPGKGTIGIEIPNNKRNIVHISDIILSEKKNKKNCNMEIPILLGKTIFNDDFVVNLIEMPHILIAGSTGQGKSVGLNSIIIFLLHKKNPKDIKFILIDPKRVELSIYEKISTSYLAMLPPYNNKKSTGIITDMYQVKNVLNSLCKEMDKRYKTLERYKARNIKEYNEYIKNKKINFPYIILIIDEFADLCISSKHNKKETKLIEKYLIRLSQLSRAVGIHLIIATQRPSVDVITGLIKANFPARIAFKVSSKVDSITILDCSGAEKLIGKGDLLFYNKNELIRLQCPFINLSDIKKIVNYYGNKSCKENKYFLPYPTKDLEI